VRYRLVIELGPPNGGTIEIVPGALPYLYDADAYTKGVSVSERRALLIVAGGERADTGLAGEGRTWWMGEKP
jgi:Ni,Fe-hydrogenase III small subunit